MSVRERAWRELFASWPADARTGLLADDCPRLRGGARPSGARSAVVVDIGLASSGLSGADLKVVLFRAVLLLTPTSANACRRVADEGVGVRVEVRAKPLRPEHLPQPA